MLYIFFSALKRTQNHVLNSSWQQDFYSYEMSAA